MSKKRITVIFVLVILSAASIFMKQQDVRLRRNKIIASTFSEWRNNGKPVVVKEILPKDVYLFTKLTLRPLGEKTFEGYVPKIIWKKLAKGQDIYITPESANAVGHITEISRDISLDTGMFRVKAVFEEPVNSGNWQVVCVNTGILPDVICVPDNIIDRENGKAYIWKVEDGRAVRQPLEVGEDNGYGAVILEGLQEGELAVYEGFTRLSEGDLVDIIKDTDDPGEAE